MCIIHASLLTPFYSGQTIRIHTETFSFTSTSIQEPKRHGTEQNVRYSEDPVITNYLVNNKNIRYSRVTKLNQAEQWDIHHAKQSTDFRVNSYI